MHFIIDTSYIMELLEEDKYIYFSYLDIMDALLDEHKLLTLNDFMLILNTPKLLISFIFWC